jgi:formylglycine-generating enzyme required for sulfatase activity/serine/threonine protein kinase
MPGSSSYEKFEPLGRNNCANIYDGFDKSSNCEVVILELQQQFQSGGDAVWDDVERARTAPLENTVERHALVKDEHWIVIQKLDASLKDRLRFERQVDPNLVRSAMYRTLQALASYEEAEILHGSVKPGNLLHFNQDFVKLNFSPGLRLGGQLAQPCCDFRYMAPEIIDPSFGDVGPASDLYSLGFTALELLLGKDFAKLVPGVRGLVDSPDDTGWMRWHTSSETHVPSVAKLLPSAPEDVVRVIDRLLKKNVIDRYTSAREALVDLEKRPDVRVDAGRKTKVVADQPVQNRTAARKRTFKDYIDSTIEWSQTAWQDPKKKQWIILWICLLVAAPFLWALFFPARTQVQFDSEPTGATVVIDGRTTESFKTSTRLLMDPGTYKMKMMLEGYDSHTQEFIVEQSGEVVSISHEFELAKREIRVRSTPGNAKVVITGTSEPASGSTPFDTKLRPGKYTIEVALDRYITQTREVSVEPGESRLDVAFELKTPIPDGLDNDKDPAVDLDYGYPLWTVSTKYPEMRFAFVRPGEFLYGVHPTVAGEGLSPGELEARPEKVEAPLYISVTEVSNGWFDKFLAERGESRASAAEDSELPATQLTIEQAREFCSSVSEGGRLPTEIEWEWVAGGGERMRPWSDAGAPDETRCRFNLLPGADNSPVSVFALEAGATPQGVQNLLGNVAEWCESIYEPGYEEQDGDPGVGEWPSIRGGSFVDRIQNPNKVRITIRASSNPAGANDIGFRVLIPLPAVP